MDELILELVKRKLNLKKNGTYTIQTKVRID